ncbi:hypothetical protein [Winogradskyella sp. SM1960]|uniref:hypothetical protein n=1 Tax=Winogradskyella sp. SM1960 TaxID=2865955 RepID=UPI001CD2D4F3|nr:hypothetical protein [Winogradskyella sp. SM1960]
MKKIVFILIILFQINLFGQNTEYKEITKIKGFKPTRIISLSDTINSKKWESFSQKRKEKIKQISVEKQIDIENDTSNVTQLLYYGIKENIEIKINDTIFTSKNLNNQSKKYAYVINDHPSNEKTFEIGTLKRNSGIQELTIYFQNKKRFGRIKIDTNYSQVYIIPEIDIEIIEFEKMESTQKNADKKPKPVKTKLVKATDRIMINYRIPNRKHSW